MNWLVAGFHTGGDFDNSESIKADTQSVSQQTNPFRRILKKWMLFSYIQLWTSQMVPAVVLFHFRNWSEQFKITERCNKRSSSKASDDKFKTFLHWKYGTLYRSAKELSCRHWLTDSLVRLTEMQCEALLYATFREEFKRTQELYVSEAGFFIKIKQFYTTLFKYPVIVTARS